MLGVDAPMRMLLDLDQMGIRYSNVVIAGSQDFYRRSPWRWKGIVRACPEGISRG
jgi:hypothetical protein